MIEQIARAMCAANGGDWNAADFNETLNGESPEEQREYWKDCATAAVKAMREPSVAMISAAKKVCGFTATEIMVKFADSEMVDIKALIWTGDDEWRAMIDAILQEAG